MDKGTFERIYSSREVCASLSIASSTLRTWCIELESSGYIFSREKRDSDGNPIGNRIFYEHDITALRMMKDLLDRGHPKTHAVTKISEEYRRMTHTVTVSSPPIYDVIDTELIPSQTRHLSLDDFKQELLNEFRQIVRYEIAVARDSIQPQLQLPMATIEDMVSKHIDVVKERIDILQQSQITDAAYMLRELKAKQKELNVKVDNFIEESRAERHRKKSLWERIIGK